ncbi:heme exporter protein A [Palleronia aestuarii]|uniref:Heme exporter protein A n=1 Tax=Palleronia aestuarii TaxID=568105 RepID=A0A2W7NB85_9RHOB|nr:heme ABC exporter ATP-binding protein CcmA [Palleronia aestuarii]PZX17591.1 heme exporter protein A [Palleronia aestuarii]
MNAPPLVLDGVAVARGGVPVLEGVTVRADPGTALILRGPNGAGKTTLLRTIAGLQAPIAGEIAPGPDQVAYGAHADGMKGGLTVAENLAFWAGIHGTGGIGEALDAFGLARLSERAAQHLSAGQARRLGLARLLLTGRPVWLLDEPTVSLDAEGVGLFGQVVRAHLGRGGIAAIATHVDLGIAGVPLDLAGFRARSVPAEGALAWDV